MSTLFALCPKLSNKYEFVERFRFIFESFLLWERDFDLGVLNIEDLRALFEGVAAK